MSLVVDDAAAPPAAAGRLVDVCGTVISREADRWFDRADAVDERVLDGVVGPALDVGCGPGRHVIALAERGVPTLGIDVTDGALDHARGQGATVLERCVFSRVPGAGRWRSALLLDGNIGIGGDPVALLRRVAELLDPTGRLLVETAAPDSPHPVGAVRLETARGPGPWFAWSVVTAPELREVAIAAGLTVETSWRDQGRGFAWLSR